VTIFRTIKVIFNVNRFRASKAVGDLLERPCYLSRVVHDRKIRSRKQKADIEKYSFLNRTIPLWNQLPADVLGNLSCKPSNFREKVRKVKIKRSEGGIIEKAVK
jgi:hypothetical protein